MKRASDVEYGLCAARAYGFITSLLDFKQLPEHAVDQAKGILANYESARAMLQAEAAVKKQDNISESQALAIESEIKQIMGEMK